MMISVSLMSVLTLVLAVLLNGQMRVSTRTNERISLERNHLRLQETMRQDVVAANAVGVSLDEVGNRLGFQPSDDVAADGEVLYSTSVLTAYFYSVPDRELRRKHWSANPPITLVSPPARILPSQWATLTSGRAPQVQTWSNLAAFRLRSDSGLYLNPRIWVDCTWKENSRTWTVTYCLSSRQIP